MKSTIVVMENAVKRNLRDIIFHTRLMEI
jgi:hypothetical protein